MSLIDVRHLTHTFYIKDTDGNVIRERNAVEDVNFQAAKGKIIAVIGKNGSGKSTFAKHLNALLVPTEGTVIIAGKNTAEEKQLLSVRKTVGMIFQNPDNQIVGNSVAEDIGFGLENLGVESGQIWETIYRTLEQTGLSAYIRQNPSALSGGQKQRLAVASVMAMKPECIVLDEATSMLDPAGSRMILKLVRDMNRKYGMTVIMITHHASEIVCADYVYVMKDGRIGLEGSPESVLSQTDQLWSMGVETVFPQRIWHTLTKSLTDRKLQEQAVLSMEDLICRLRDSRLGDRLITGEAAIPGLREMFRKPSGTEMLIQADHLGYTYCSGGQKKQALTDVSFQIRKGELIAVAGQTGSGKSTLLQLLNGLLRTNEGKLIVNGIDVIKEKNLKKLRQKIGFVFQYPEYQLFETSVLRDVMYGPSNFGFDKEQAGQMAIDALKLMELDEEIYEQSPLELSGGQKKRVALAGILAYRPEILILDEPTAGLDAEGKRRLFTLIRQLNREQNITVIMVSHDMNDIYELADRLFVLHQGRMVYDGPPERALSDTDFVKRYALEMPDVLSLKLALSIS